MNFFKRKTEDNTASSPSRSPPKKSSSSKSEKAEPTKHKHRSVPKPRSNSPRLKGTYHPNDHPLNLPPEELRRLSALSTMSDPMDVDVEGSVGTPTSPQAQSNLPGAFDGKTNGVSSPVNGDAPPPPVHRSNPTSPSPALAPSSADAEEFKNEGNKFYKAKEYKKAIEAYTKGNSPLSLPSDTELTYPLSSR